MDTYEWMHPKYVCRICNYLFCIHAKFHKHISPSYYKPDANVWNFAGDIHIGFFHSSVSKDSTTVREIELSHYWSNRYNSFYILLGILLMWKPFEILMIFALFLDQILWRARNKWKFLTFYLKCAISRKYFEVSKIWLTVFDSHSTKHLAKRKNEIGLTVYELKTEMWKKKKISPQNEITMVKPWNHTSNGRS